MPFSPIWFSASLTSSSLKGLMIASIFFICLGLLRAPAPAPPFRRPGRALRKQLPCQIFPQPRSRKSASALSVSRAKCPKNRRKSACKCNNCEDDDETREQADVEPRHDG